MAGKGGAGKTTLCALLAERLAARGVRTLAVDCDPNPNLAESFGLDSQALDRFSRDALRRSGDGLELARDPALAEVRPGLW
ncbi:MAG: AAA family ATPase, partial [Actinomycetota bacterium]|nr:AAA family ATPase [Actinomycetota bacterium]